MITSLNFFVLFLILVNYFFLYKLSEISNLLNVYDYPDKRKIHKKPIPLLGGFLFIINFILIYVTGLIFDKNFYILNYTFIIFGSVIFLLGFIDDKKNLPARYKFIILIIIILVNLTLQKNLLISNLYIDFFSYKLELNVFESYFFTLLCILLFMNASNLYDGINLQQAMFIFFFFLYLIFKNPNIEIIKLLIVPLIYFIYLNANNKSFLGDSGTLFISYFLSVVVIQEYHDKNLLISEILLLMIIPGIDMLRLFIFRILKNKNPFLPDRLHLHHLLLKKFSLLKTNLILLLFKIVPILIFNFFQEIFIYIILITILSYLVVIKKLSYPK